MRRRDFLKRAAAGGLFTAFTGAAAEIGASTPHRPNLLFIAIDDLNDWINCLDHGYPGRVFTPNIDRLAEQGVLFTNAHAVATMCNPSRTALWLGKRPSTTGVYGQAAQWDDNRVTSVSMPQFFRNNGYHTLGRGKIYHHGSEVHVDPGFDDVEPFDYALEHPKPEEDRRAGLLRYGRHHLPYDEMPSTRWVRWACGALRRQYDRPFFLVTGILKPHTPLWIPRKYFDLYPMESVRVPEVPVDELDDVPEPGRKLAWMQRFYSPVVRSGNVREAIRAYLAAITYVDDLVGELLEALEQGPNAGNTVVVLWSDHGFHWGEKMHFAKVTLWEEATRIPVIVKAPGVTAGGGRCARPLDSVDLYPTLADLCGLDPPPDLDGVSARPLLEDPGAPWDRPALTVNQRGQVSVRSEHLRLIRYEDGSEELYDHRTDPGEHRNLANAPAYDRRRKQLAHWIPERFAVNALPYPAWDGWLAPEIREEFRRTREQRLQKWDPPERYRREKNRK